MQLLHVITDVTSSQSLCTLSPSQVMDQVLCLRQRRMAVVVGMIRWVKQEPAQQKIIHEDVKRSQGYRSEQYWFVSLGGGAAEGVIVKDLAGVFSLTKGLSPVAWTTHWAWCDWQTAATSCLQRQHLVRSRDQIPHNIHWCICGNHQAFMPGIVNSLHCAKPPISNCK